MDELFKNLMILGLGEYQAKVYSTLVGMGEGSARQIHELSGVPRPRIYDIAEGLAERGFVEVRRGNPHVYVPVEPGVVINRLRNTLEAAANDASEALNALSLDAGKKFSPIWYVQGEWSIRRHLTSLMDLVSSDLTVVCMDYDSIGEFSGIIRERSKQHPVDILLPNGKRGITRALGDASLYIPEEFCEYFHEHIYRAVFSGPVRKEKTEFVLEYIFIADDSECMIIYLQNGSRMAVIITLPFITCVQKQFIRKMVSHAVKIEAGSV